MKKIVLTCALVFACQLMAQENQVENNPITSDTTALYNRWTIEGMLGTSDGNYPFGEGFNAGEKKNIFSQFKINSFDIGLRYMISPKFGFKGHFSYQTYSENDHSSLPFETHQMNLTFQGVVNAARLLEFKKTTKMGLLLHGGMYAASFTSKTKNIYDSALGSIPNTNYKATEYHGGFVAGITPQYRIMPKMAVFVDLSMYFNYRQHMNWDGTPNTSSDLLGKSTNLSFGVSYALGKDAMHGDWKVIQSENEIEIAALQNELRTKIEDIEIMLQDTDRDGVVDYLDAEPNTIGGVAVDTKGRAIDVNKNGVPDELEGRKGKRGFNNLEMDENQSFDYLINQGLVNLFFDLNKDTPNTASANNLYYIINFLRTYPEARIKIKGFADTSGDEQKNQALAQKRAENVAAFLMQSGIDSKRIEVLGSGVDTKLDTTSKTGLQLARRVSFELIKE